MFGTKKDCQKYLFFLSGIKPEMLLNLKIIQEDENWFHEKVWWLKQWAYFMG